MGWMAAPMSRWPRHRDRWEWAILGGTAFAVAATCLVAVSAIRGRQQAHRAALASLTNYLAVALDRYANGTETLIRQNIFPIMPPPDYLSTPAQRDPLPIADMVGMIERLQRDPCQCQVAPGQTSFFRLGLTTGEDAAADSIGHPLGTVDPMIAGAIRSQADSLRTIGYRYGFIAAATGQGEQFLFFSQRTDSLTGHRFAYGMAVPVDRIGQWVFGQAFATVRLVPRYLLDSVPSNTDFLSLEAVTRSGRILYASGPAYEEGPSDALVLPSLRGGVVIRARLNPRLKNLLIPGGVPSKLPIRELGLMTLSLTLWGMIAVLALRAADLARLRTDFASSVTHELRTPLTQIRLAAETILLGRTRDRESERRALTSVVDETGRLQQLIDNVLHWSRAERRLTKVVTQRLELRPLVAGIGETFAPLIADRRMTIRPNVPDGLFVQADPDLFRQILLNLLDNAARYGPDDQTITISARVVGPNIEIAVEDEGPGIAPADRQRVWRPFVRLDHPGGPVPGPGLGLAVARELVEAQKGRCRIEGRMGPGARVIVSLPIGASP